MPPPTSRRAHNKSRGGCTACKSRKVKCDEGKPCSYCAKRRLYCSLQVQGSSQTPLPKPVLTRAPSTTATIAAALNLDHDAPSSSAGIGGDSLTFQFSDFALFHHFTTHTSYTLGDNAACVHVWQAVVPPLAVAHPYLLHEIIAVAAVHMQWMLSNPELAAASTSSSSPASSSSASTSAVAPTPTPTPLSPTTMEALAHKAALHQSRALELFQPALATATAASAPSLFVFAAAVQMYYFAATEDAAGLLYNADIPGGAPPEWLALISGVVLIFSRHMEAIQSSAVAPLAGYDLPKPELDAMPPETWSADGMLKALKDRLPVKDQEEREKYSFPLYCLRLSYGFSDMADSVLMRKIGALRFPAMVDMWFKEQLGQREPAALIIMAWWCACMHRLREKWWVGTKLTRMVEFICSQITEEERELIQWPCQQVGLA